MYTDTVIKSKSLGVMLDAGSTARYGNAKCYLGYRFMKKKKQDKGQYCMILCNGKEGRQKADEAAILEIINGRIND